MTRDRTPDFWYLVGYDYEIIVCATLDDAEKMKAAHTDPDYYHIFEGWYDQEFSGWLGRHEDDNVG